MSEGMTVCQLSDDNSSHHGAYPRFMGSPLSPKVSIVVPMYQSGRTVAATLRAISAQTFSNMEIIVVDDGSTDDGPSIAADAARSDARIRVVTQENRGLSGARNSGIAASRAEFVGFCDADDLWDPTKVQRHLELLDANPGVGISFAGSVIVDGDLRPTGVVRCPEEGAVDLATLICRNPVGNGSTVIARRSCLDEVSYVEEFPEGSRRCWFDERLRQCEDIDMWCRVAAGRKWQIYGIPMPLTAYRVHQGSLSGNAGRMMGSWRAMRDKIMGIAPEEVSCVASLAEATQWMWHARKAVMSLDRKASVKCVLEAFRSSPMIAIREPFRTAQTVAAVAVLAFGGSASTALIRRAFEWKRRNAASFHWLRQSPTEPSRVDG